MPQRFSCSSLFNCLCVWLLITVFTDALPAVWHRDADMGIFSTVCHQVICLLVATCSSCLFTRPCSTDKQGNYSKLAVIATFVVVLFFSGLRHDCVAGVGVLLCTMCLSVLLLCLWTLFLQVSLHTSCFSLHIWGHLYWYQYNSVICLCVWHRAVCKKFGLHVGRLMLAFLVLSTGMFCSSAGWSHLFTCLIQSGLCCHILWGNLISNLSDNFIQSFIFLSS